MKENADDLEMRVEYVRNAFSLLSARCYWRLSGRCEKRERYCRCSIQNCPLLESEVSA